MTKINIAAELLEKCPNLKLGCIECTVEMQENNPDLWIEINTKIEEISSVLKTEDISKLPNIAASRKGYKSTGKDPSRYRLSAEALLRRIVKGKGLYQINNVVDLINLTSFSSGFSIGGYNSQALDGTVTFGIGKENEAYEGIGRGSLNIAFLPVFRDETGTFGSPTSDSPRTSVGLNTQQFLMIIIDFENRPEDLKNTMDLAVRLLENYAAGKDFKVWID